MPSKELLNQFWQTLDQSKTFQSLPAEKQIELKEMYADVDDDQLVLALEELKKDAAQAQSSLEEQLALTQLLKNNLKNVQKQERNADDLDEREESGKAAEAMLANL